MIQEWWGLVDHIKDVCDRFAAEGFVALAPDLYRGAKTTEPDEAAKAMMALRLDQAAKDMSGAVDEVASRSSGAGVGVVGFCMGGGLALMLASQRPDKVRAVVPVLRRRAVGGRTARLLGALSGAVLGHYAGKDESASPEAARALVRTLRQAGNSDVDIHIYPEADHAFFNDTRPEVYDAEASRARLAADPRVPALPSGLSATMTPKVVERYLALGLALGRHVERARRRLLRTEGDRGPCRGGPLTAPAHLVAEARALLGGHRRGRAARRPGRGAPTAESGAVAAGATRRGATSSVPRPSVCSRRRASSPARRSATPTRSRPATACARGASTRPTSRPRTAASTRSCRAPGRSRSATWPGARRRRCRPESARARPSPRSPRT